MSVKKPIAVVATAALVMTGASFGAAAAQATPEATAFAPLSEFAIPANGTEETAVYNGWHFDPSHQNTNQTSQVRNGLSIPAESDVLLVKGTGNDGADINPTAPSLEAVASDLGIVASSKDGITLQVPVRIDANDNGIWEQGVEPWSTLRTSAADPTVWTTSKAIGGIAAQGKRTLEQFAGITGIYPIAAGLLVQNKTSPTVISSLTSNGETTKFYAEPVASASWTGDEYVSASGIAGEENDATYGSWHNGDKSGTSYETVRGSAWGETLGLKVTGKTQILKGLVGDDVLSNLGSLAGSMQIDVVDGEVWAQIPIFAYPDGAADKVFTTIRALVPASGNLADAAEWVSSKALGEVPANTNTTLAAILAAAGQHDVIGYGFFVGAGQTATVSGVTFNGKTTTFAKAANEVTTENVPVSTIVYNENETSVYNQWHFGPGTGYTTTAAQTDAGVSVAANTRTQIIKGNGNDQAVPAVKGSIADFLDSLDIEATGPAEAITYQIGVRVDVDGDGTWTNGPGAWTTLRAEVNAEDGRWTTSKALTGIAAGASATTAEIVAALGSNAYVYSAGFLVYDAASAVTVSSFSANGVKTTFEAAPATATATTLVAPTTLVEGDAGSAVVSLAPVAPGTLELFHGDEVLATSTDGTGTVTADLSELKPGSYDLQGKFTPENAALFTGSVSETVTVVISAKPAVATATTIVAPTTLVEGDAGSAVVSLAPAAPGTLELFQNGVVVATADENSATVTADLSELKPGSYELQGKFTPENAALFTASSSETVTVVVTAKPAVPATSTATSISAPTKLIAGATGVATVNLAPKAAGTLELLQNGTTVKTVAGITGSASIDLSKLPAGTYTLQGKFTPADAAAFEPSVSKTVTLVVSANPLIKPTPTFGDMPAGAKFSKEIGWLAQQGITTGVKQADGSVKFMPKDKVTREAMAAFIYRLAALKDPAVASFKAPAVSPFADLKPGDKFYKEITWMKSAKLTTGIKQASGKPNFAPKSAITREAMAVFMYRLDTSAKPAKPSSSPFADLNVNDKFFKEMAWMKTSGLSTGIKQASGDPKFAPKSSTSREAMAAFMFRVNSLLK